MQIGRLSVDGASFLTGLIVCGVVGSISKNVWEDNGRSPVGLGLLIAMLIVISIGFLWLSIRIGENRRRARDVRRWMGEYDD